MPKIALITGITGQDGSYLTELLISKGYQVHGVIRKASNFNTGRIEHLYNDPQIRDISLHLHYGDVMDGNSLRKILKKVAPDEIYNLAAQSHVATSFEIAEYTGIVNGNSVYNFLYAVLEVVPRARFYQASTSELFGSSIPPQSEVSVMQPRSPYAISKLSAYWTVKLFREAFGLFAVNGILFNHESPRRNETFVTRKISAAAAKIKLGFQEKLNLGNIESIRDWGYAPEYVEAMWMMLQSKYPKDYVVATGVGATVGDFCSHAFAHLNLDWRDYVVFDKEYLRPLEVDNLVGDARLIKKELGWEYRTDWKKLAEIMVNSDFEDLNYRRKYK
jgi:GDPmannose 4,6-dehydratase